MKFISGKSYRQRIPGYETVNIAFVGKICEPYSFVIYALPAKAGKPLAERR